MRIRKREVVHVCDGSNSGAIKCDVTERCVVKCLITIPVHRKHGSVTLRGHSMDGGRAESDTYTKPVAAMEQSIVRSVSKVAVCTYLISASPAWREIGF